MPKKSKSKEDPTPSSPSRKESHSGSENSSNASSDSERETRHHKKKKSKRHSSLPFKSKALTKEDYFLKSTEFRVWLSETQKIKNKHGKKEPVYFDSLTSDESRQYFKKFIRRWNKGKLKDKFYQGIAPKDAPHTSNHNWAFAQQLNKKETQKIVNEVDGLTNLNKGVDNTSASRGGSMDAIKGTKRVVKGPTMPQMGEVEESLREMHQSKRAENKYKNKEYRKNQEVAMEELVPKATGRDAMIEKKKARNSYLRREDSPTPDLGDDDIFGGDDFKQRVQQQRAREAKRDAKRLEKKAAYDEQMESKRKAYQEKEAATLAMFKEMAQRHKLG